MKPAITRTDAELEMISIIETLVAALHNAADHMEFEKCEPEAIKSARTQARVNCYLKQYGITIKSELNAA